MKREELISKVIENFKNASQIVDTEEKKAKEIFSEEQLELIEEIWSYDYDFNKLSYEELEDWNNQLDDFAALMNINFKTI